MAWLAIGDTSISLTELSRNLFGMSLVFTKSTDLVVGKCGQQLPIYPHMLTSTPLPSGLRNFIDFTFGYLKSVSSSPAADSRARLKSHPMGGWVDMCGWVAMHTHVLNMLISIASG